MSDRISVLVIDDDKMIKQLVQHALSENNFDLHLAEDGATGLEIVAEQDIDVILLDWVMPGMEGIEVLRRLKLNEKTRHIPVFMLTGKDNKSDIDQAISLGIESYITKPFRSSNLPETIRKAAQKNNAGENAKGKFGISKSLAGLFSGHKNQ
jgi:DNA-binding response OmpR family regulator